MLLIDCVVVPCYTLTLSAVKGYKEGEGYGSTLAGQLPKNINALFLILH